ncbi:MAG: hypothetical protein DRO65_00670 [Candidatus Altiarchaeales archaeon]|nr:MAG: hypothetical protein DRO65_00670 [Candidatus Altiarchaeales archaeon]
MAVESTLLLVDLGYVIIAATFFAILARILKQPLILAYIIAGMVIGPNFLGIIVKEEIISTLAEFGISLLLFIVGLELDFTRLRDVGKVSLNVGLGQMLITFIVCYLLVEHFLAGKPGYNVSWPVYIAFCLTISSTMVVVKLLSDKDELDTLQGKIVLGTLLFQDIVSIIMLAIIASSDLSSLAMDPRNMKAIFVPIFSSMGLVSIAIVCSRYVVPYILKEIAKSLELLLLFALSWCFIFTYLGYLVGLPSIAVGSFLAGISLASYPYNLEIVGRVKSLRDFFSTIFFVSLGMKIPLDFQYLYFALILSIFVLFLKPLTTMLITSLMGYTKRITFLSGIYLAQISEFSLIIAQKGVEYGHIPKDVLSLITLVGVITITLSSYLITYGSKIYNISLPLLSVLDTKAKRKRDLYRAPSTLKRHIILFGCDKTGEKILKTIISLRRKFIVVDINPDIISRLSDEGVPCIYGDMSDLEILEKVGLKDAEVIISTVPNHEANLTLLLHAKKENPKSLVFVVEKDIDKALELYNAGADYVIVPDLLAGERLSEYLADYILNLYKVEEMKKIHIRELENIKREEILGIYESSILKELERKYGLKTLK